MMAVVVRGGSLIKLRTEASNPTGKEFCTCALTGFAAQMNSDQRRPLVM